MIAHAAATRARYTRQRAQVLHRQRQRGGDRLDLRQASPAPATTSSSPPTRSTSATSCVQNVVRQPELRLRVRAPRLPAHRGGHPAQGPRGLGRRAQHRQHRQVQPRLGLDRHLHARVLRGHRLTPRNRRLYKHARHRLPARAADVRRRLRAPGRDEALRAARRRLHALGLARGPALPALQPDGEDEGHDPGRGGHQPALGRRSPPRASRRTCTSSRPRATSAACRSSRARSTSTSR